MSERTGQPWNDYPELSEEVKSILNRLNEISDELFEVVRHQPSVRSSSPEFAIGVAVDDLLALAVDRRWEFISLKASMVAIQALPPEPMDN